MESKGKVTRETRREVRREARRNAILKDPEKRLKSLTKIGDKSTPSKDAGEERRFTNPKLINNPLNNDTNNSTTPSIDSTALPRQPYALTTPTDKPVAAPITTPTNKPSTSFILNLSYHLVLQRSLLRLVLPLVISLLINTMADYNSVSIVMMAGMNTLLLVGHFIIIRPVQGNNSSLDHYNIAGLLEFLGSYYPSLATLITVVSLILSLLYSFIIDLTLCIFSLCFVQLSLSLYS